MNGLRTRRKPKPRTDKHSRQPHKERSNNNHTEKTLLTQRGFVMRGCIVLVAIEVGVIARSATTIWIWTSRVSTDLSRVTHDQLDHAAYSLNTRPRQTLGDMTPSEKLAQVLQ